MGEKAEMRRYEKGKPGRDIKGHRFGWLVVTEFSHIDKKRRVANWHCVCDCGNEVVADLRSLVSGKKKSCGCSEKIRHENHGRYVSMLYRRKHGLGEFSFMRDIDAGYDLITSDDIDWVDIDHLETIGLGDRGGKMWDEVEGVENLTEWGVE